MSANKSVYLKVCLLAVVISSAFMSGCATFGSALLGETGRTDGEYTNGRLGLVLKLPSGWYMDDCDRASVYITKAGFGLNMFHVSKNGPDSPLPLTGKSVFHGMLSVDAASVVLDEERHSENLTGFKVVSSSPSEVAGRPGCRIEYTYRLNGIGYRNVTYGFVNGEYLYRIQYIAPERFYFSESSVPFERVVASAKLR